eukprot:6441059-Alexandrium_andersonii.AAC.1
MVSAARSRKNSAVVREGLGTSLSPASSCKRPHQKQKLQKALCLAGCADTSLRPHVEHFQLRA